MGIHEALEDRTSQEFKDWVMFVAENDPHAAQAVDQALYKIRNEEEARAIFNAAVAGQVNRDKAWADLYRIFELVFSRGMTFNRSLAAGEKDEFKTN